MADRIYEKQLIREKLEGMADGPDPGDCFLDEIVAFYTTLKAKYPNHRFGIESDYDWTDYFAERMETDEEFEKRRKDSIARSERMKRYYAERATRDSGGKDA